MPTKDDMLKQFQLEIFNAKRNGDDSLVQSLNQQRKRYKTSRKRKKGSQEKGNAINIAAVSNEDSMEQSVSKKLRKETCRATTESVKVTTRPDGSKTEEKSVKHEITEAEEVILTMTNKVKSMKQVAITSYSGVREQQFGLDIPQGGRKTAVEKELVTIPSPYEPSKTMLESIKNLSISELLRQEHGFLQESIKMGGIQHLPTKSAMKELVIQIDKDVKVYLPYQVYQQGLEDEDVEREITREMGIAKYRQMQDDEADEDLEGERRTKMLLHFRKTSVLKKFHGPPEEQESRMNRLVIRNAKAMNEESNLEEKIVSKYVAKALDMPGWTKKQMKFNEQLHQWDKPRMQRAIDIEETLKDVQNHTEVCSIDGIWGNLQTELVNHFIALKSLLGCNVDDMKVYPKGLQMSKWRVVNTRSFFTLDTASATFVENIMMAKFNIEIPPGTLVKNVEVEVPLLRNGAPNAFAKMKDFDTKKYINNPDWDLVTPDNLLLRAYGRATPEVTTKIDRLLCTYPEHSKTITELEDMVVAIWKKGIDDQTNYSRLVRLLPKHVRQEESRKKIDQLCMRLPVIQKNDSSTKFTLISNPNK